MEALTTNQKPRMRVIPMGLYWGDELLYETPPRIELRPGPESPFTIDQTFIGVKPEKVYATWLGQVEYWREKLAGAPRVAG